MKPFDLVYRHCRTNDLSLAMPMGFSKSRDLFLQDRATTLKSS
ncbi:hypothetical protein FHX15_005421 [Rhizobium sp. BK650]|nr:hypothetical protein [Rhizobium sp. BK650]